MDPMIAAAAGSGVTLISALVGFWMGKKTVRPDERVFTELPASTEDSDILNTPELFEELVNKEEDKDARVSTIRNG